MLFWCLYNKLRTYFWSLRRSLFLLKFHAFHVNSCERLCGGVCFQHQAMKESIFSKASGLSYKWQWKSLRWRFRRSLLLASGCESLLLVKFIAVTINGSEGVCDEVCLLFQAWQGMFSKISDLYNKWLWCNLWWILFLASCLDGVRF